MGATESKAAPAAKAHKPTFKKILDQYESIEEVQQGLREAGLESSQLIVGLDFTKSNEWSGQKTFNSRCLHSISQTMNPYEHALSIIAKTMAPFDDDNLIPCYGFGDLTSKDKKVFSFFPDNRPANGLHGAMMRYRQIAPHVQLSGPTSFAPILRQAMRTVLENGNEYHILVIVADGQVTPSCYQDTVDAIVLASKLPLSIVMIGVGDGPWADMEKFDDELPARAFDNFQFVNFAKVMGQAAVYREEEKKEAHFATHALMEIPEQYGCIQKLRLMDPRNTSSVVVSPQVRHWLPPPPPVLAADANFLDNAANAPGFVG
ncbi:hypothetical protein BSKO_02030 [Bryopsis sp. KO-2023]|nr:hypothetical protein BSKO_02030 [Bryopsis sp. KO-2023]